MVVRTAFALIVRTMLAIAALGCTEDAVRQGGAAPDDAEGPAETVGEADSGFQADAHAAVDSEVPVIAFTNLVQGEEVTGTFDVTVETADNVGVVRVDFALNGTEQAQVSGAPFSWTWSSASYANGNYILTAVARDAAGNASEPASVEVRTSNKSDGLCAPPQVNIIFPTNEAVVCGELHVEAALSGECEVALAELFVGEQKVGEATAEPWRFPWNTEGLPDGETLLRVSATDSKGQESHQLITLVVDNEMTPCDNPPAVSFVTPPSGAYVHGPVAVEAKASDDFGVEKVRFLVDNNLIEELQFPYAFTWDTDPHSENVHTLKAVAYDVLGKTSQRQIQVVIDRTPPTVSWVSPSEDALVAGEVLLVADASDSAALAEVQFFAIPDGSGEEHPIGSVPKWPFQVTWAPSALPSGPYLLQARAVDKAGHTTSASRPVSLDRKPTITISAPGSGQTVGGAVTISGEVGDDLGVDVVQLTLDGEPFDTFSGSGSFERTWDTSLVPYGEHVLLAKVIDSAGQSASAEVTVLVDQPLWLGLQICSSDSFLDCAPAAASEVTGPVHLLADAVDDNASVVELAFLVDDEPVASQSEAPFTTTWDSTQVPDGPYTVLAQVETTLPQTKTQSLQVMVNNCDLDHDGHLAGTLLCGGGDCNDGNDGAATYPGAPDHVTNGQDNDCDGIPGVDADGDGVPSLASGGTDCDDDDPDTYPGAPDGVGDGVDQDCDATDGTDESDGMPSSELMLKILGTPLASGPGEHLAVVGAVTPFHGIVFGEPDSITWEASNGESGDASGSPYWQSSPVLLDPGVNTITVTATKGSQAVTDRLTVTYNPGFLFDRSPMVLPDVLWANEPTTLAVSVPITLYKNFDSSSARLWRVDAAGSPVNASPVSSLGDDGKLSSCDEIDQDGVFSTCLSNFKCTGEDVFFAVTVTVLGADGSTSTAWTAPTRVECGERISPSSCSSAQLALKDARSAYDQAGGGQTGQQAAIDYLTSQANVTAAGPSAGGGNGVWVEFTDGYLGALNLTGEGLRGPGGGAATASAETLARLSRSAENDVKTISSKRALVMAAYNDELGADDEAIPIADMVAGSGCPTFSLDGPQVDGEVTLSLLRQQYLHGIVVLTTHGDAMFGGLEPAAMEKYDWDHVGSQEVLWSGEAATCNSLTSSSKTCSHQAGCPAGTDCVITGGQGTNLSGRCVDYTQMDLRKGRVVLTDQTWAITAPFVSRYARRPMPGSLVYLGACRTLYNGTLAAEYMSVGAKAIAGYSGYVHNEFAAEAGQAFFSRMFAEADDTGGAYHAAPHEDPSAPGNYFWLFGATNLDIMDASIINPSFESIDLAGWTTDGDARVIAKLGATNPVHGKFMGVISTGLGFTVQTGELAQTFCIPEDKVSLSFYWKFFSEEFKEYCGSSYQDSFVATMTNAIGQLTLTDVKIDDLCHYADCFDSGCDPGAGNCQCGSQYVGLIASDVSFDQGEVYSTQWQLREMNIQPLAGQGPVDLRFFSTDKGDSIFDTVILIDDVVFN